MQVGNGTGARTYRHADAVAMSLWPSRGLDLYGFEIKVSRSDWRRELVQPEKADEIARYCDFWFIAAPEGVVPVDELPTPWGLYEFDGKALRVAKPAVRLEAPKEMTRAFLAAILRRAAEANVPQKWLDEARAEAVADAKRIAESETSYLRKDYKQLQEKVAEFEAASGICLGRSWESGTKIGTAVRAVLDVDARNVQSIVNLYRRGLECAEALLAATQVTTGVSVNEEVA
ncbi:hypothetical protein [Luteitalea sp.]|uniref:hypothetical protein n=1 Tax=Luteitalea sp. TaxID=2004800 RepID=UPI0025C16CAB|nr:hypothetical protein [Luteitalea sp.]